MARGRRVLTVDAALDRLATHALVVRAACGAARLTLVHTDDGVALRRVLDHVEAWARGHAHLAVVHRAEDEARRCDVEGAPRYFTHYPAVRAVVHAARTTFAAERSGWVGNARLVAMLAGTAASNLAVVVGSPPRDGDAARREVQRTLAARWADLAATAAERGAT